MRRDREEGTGKRKKRLLLRRRGVLRMVDQTRINLHLGTRIDHLLPLLALLLLLVLRSFVLQEDRRRREMGLGRKVGKGKIREGE